MLNHVTEEKIRVRYGETDQMGHAYYANYLFWFEQARGAWCRARGFSYRDMEAMGYFLPVVEAHAEYRGEVLFDDVITVRVWRPRPAAPQFASNTRSSTSAPARPQPPATPGTS